MKIPTKRWITLKSTPLNFPRATSLKAQLTQRIQKLNLLPVSAMNLFTLLDAFTSTALRLKPVDLAVSHLEWTRTVKLEILAETAD